MHACLTVVTRYFLAQILGGLIYNSATVAELFPTYSNSYSDRCVVILLTLIIDSRVRSTYSNVLHMVLNGGIANIADMIRGDRQIVINVPIS